MGKNKKHLYIIIKPKYINGKPTVVLSEGTYCTLCNTFLAPPEATDDERIQAAIDHTCTTGTIKQSSNKP